MTTKSPTAAMALFTVVSEGIAAPSLVSAARQLGVAVQDLDATFGVVPIDLEHHLFAVQARADRVPASAASGCEYRGPYSTPEIAPVAPPRPDDDGSVS